MPMPKRFEILADALVIEARFDCTLSEYADGLELLIKRLQEELQAARDGSSKDPELEVRTCMICRQPMTAKSACAMGACPALFNS